MRHLPRPFLVLILALTAWVAGCEDLDGPGELPAMFVMTDFDYPPTVDGTADPSWWPVADTLWLHEDGGGRRARAIRRVVGDTIDRYDISLSWRRERGKLVVTEIRNCGPMAGCVPPPDLVGPAVIGRTWRATHPMSGFSITFARVE